MAVRKPTKAQSGAKQAPPKPPRQAAPARAIVKQLTVKGKAPANHLDAAVERLEATVTELKTERDRLEAELAAARKKIGALEEARVDAINRIDWVIDSLESLAQK